jgi:hypothetical protein
MKTGKLCFGLLAVAAAFILSSCGSSVTLTSWKNPDYKSQVSKVAIMPMFEKLEYMKPFEQAVDSYFERQGLKAIGSLDFLNPSLKYSIDEIKKKCDSLGVDAILVFVYEGTDKTETYVPQTTYVSGGYGGYWGGGYWGGGYYGSPYYGTTAVSTGGYWTSTAVVNLKASLYTRGYPDGVWTGNLSVTDPEYVDQVADKMAQYIYSDWKKYGLIKFATK